MNLTSIERNPGRVMVGIILLIIIIIILVIALVVCANKEAPVTPSSKNTFQSEFQNGGTDGCKAYCRPHNPTTPEDSAHPAVENFSSEEANSLSDEKLANLMHYG